jgi:hypothetical protein
MEMILRFFAFLYYAGKYQSQMKDFLNLYMATNRHLKKQSKKELFEIFAKTSQTILSAIGPKAFRPQRAINAAVLDSVMTGVAERILAKGEIKSKGLLKECFGHLMNDAEYMAAVETGTAQEANIKTRFTKAEMSFANVR